MQPRHTVFVGSEPPSDREFDWVVEPAALTSLAGEAQVPDIAQVKRLLAEAAPIVGELTDRDPDAFLRDELFQLVLSTARAEATRRSLEGSGPVTIVSSQRLSRPSRPGRIAEGLARFLDADLEWVGARRPRAFPASVLGVARVARWTRGSRSPEARVVMASGGPSERRALEPVAARVRSGTVSMVDFSLVPDRELPSFGAHLRFRDVVGGVQSGRFADRLAGGWGSADWWGAKWLPWIRPSLGAMSKITLREAVSFYTGARRALEGVGVLVTAKVRFARARAIVAAAHDLGVPTVAIQHGMYVDGPEWTDLRSTVFGVSGQSFGTILDRRGYAGEIVPVGAPFYRIPGREWDCGIALQPPEGIVITSASDYERHARTAWEAARRVFGDDATVGFRLHPREDEDRLRRIIGPSAVITRDHRLGGRHWISIESSFVVEAVLSGAPTVLLNLNGHPWEYRFADMPGIRVATDPQGLESELRNMIGVEEAGHLGAWREEFAVAAGDEAADRVARLIEERLA